MKIGTRITLVTVTLVMVTLGLYSYVSVRNRRLELFEDSQRQLEQVGTAVRVPLEAALRDGLFQDVGQLIGRFQAAEPTIGFTFIDLQHQKPGEQPPAFAASNSGNENDAPFVLPPPDPTRAARILRVAVEGRAVGAHTTVSGRKVYALVEPILGAEHRVAGAIELVRDESNVEAVLSTSTRNALFAMGGLGLMLALLLWLSTSSGISNPLKRLVEAIDDVTRGDLGRVILRERDDEVGDLAERFNEMTASLREARAQILLGVDAKLALEARLRHAEKLATIGQLAAGIAHEVGTPLNVIGGRARTMEKRAGEALRVDWSNSEASSESQVVFSPAEVAKNASIIAAQTQRITRIIQQLLDFARRPQSVRTSVDLAKVAKDCLDFLEHQLSTRRIDARLRSLVVEDEGAPIEPTVRGDADQLQQVCLNLCVNALQAMPTGGVLELALRTLVCRRPGLDAAAPGHYVVLDVADTGAGIPESDRDRIFEPFYSTKSSSGDEREGGTGLGLSVSVGIVKDHDGWIEIAPRPGGGTIFRVFLPALDPFDSL
jgi:signal transduction histidine kinase